MNDSETGLQRWLVDAALGRSAANLERRRNPLQALDAVRVSDGERELLNFSANDYLGLAGHPELAAALRAVPATVGAGASALVSGYRREHHALERELADFLDRDRALLFSSGYLANLAVATSLAGRGDLIVQDRLCHASLIDAARLSGAKLARYPHLDVDGLARQLARTAGGRKLVMTDGVFSMDGDLAPLARIQAEAAAREAWLVVDDAHGIGVTGPGGRGSVAAAGLDQQQVPVLVGTLGKAFGCSGAFVAGSAGLIEHLVNEARTYMFTTALPPVLAEAARAALVRARKDHWRREKLDELIRMFRAGARSRGLALLESGTPIQPVMVGEPEAALRVSAALRERGFLAVAIRPPTVPPGTARLRITLSASHEPEQLTALLDALAECLATS
jgi:8-amino-7-oxononanoate synthase